MLQASVGSVKVHIVAESPEGLSKAMLQNNLKFGAMCQYTDINQGKDGKWYAWFLIDLEKFQRVNGE